jgi:hypothetical protein
VLGERSLSAETCMPMSGVISAMVGGRMEMQSTKQACASQQIRAERTCGSGRV